MPTMDDIFITFIICQGICIVVGLILALFGLESISTQVRMYEEEKTVNIQKIDEAFRYMQVGLVIAIFGGVLLLPLWSPFVMIGVAIFGIARNIATANRIRSLK